MRKTEHIVVLGPGRCGTTAFVRLLHNLGYYTGFSDDEVNRDLGPGGHGLEWPIRGSKAKHPMPYVLKNPALSLDLLNRIERWNWNINYAYILVRNIENIINSRFERTRGTNLVSEKDREEFRKLSFLKTGGALLNCVSLKIPYSILEYPRWAQDPGYCYQHIYESFDYDYNLISFDYKYFLNAYYKTVDFKRNE